MRCAENLWKHELIGLRTKVADSGNPSLIGLEGKVVGETKNLLILEINGNEKKVPKKDCTFSFPQYKVRINGKVLLARPEDRTKKK